MVAVAIPAIQLMQKARGAVDGQVLTGIVRSCFTGLTKAVLPSELGANNGTVTKCSLVSYRPSLHCVPFSYINPPFPAATW